MADGSNDGLYLVSVLPNYIWEKGVRRVYTWLQYSHSYLGEGSEEGLYLTYASINSSECRTDRV